MARSEQEAKVGAIIQQVCQRYLNVQVETVGVFPYDAAIERWVSRMDPESFVQGSTEGALAAAYQLAYRMLRSHTQPSAKPADVLTPAA